MPELDALDTPSVLVDVDVVARNVERMAGWARAAGVALRPHAKTHKSPEIAGLQLRAGACGLSLAKVGEAEALLPLVDTDDLFLAYPVVGADKARRLLALADKARLAVGVDSVEGAASLAGVFAAAGRVLDLCLKIDVGYGRVGVLPAQAVEVARAITKLQGARLRGVFTHAGHAYGGSTPEEVARIGGAEGATLAEVAATLRADGIGIEDVSVGSTPTARHAMTPGVTECRPGNYVYHDASQVALGTCTLADCALTVLATVVSVPRAGRAVVDAGSKTLSSDPLRPRAGGHGQILGTRSIVDGLSEEHGWVAVADGDVFRVGQKVRILPNHACVVSNLHDRLVAVRGDEVTGTITVAARGRVQ